MSTLGALAIDFKLGSEGDIMRQRLIMRVYKSSRDRGRRSIEIKLYVDDLTAERIKLKLGEGSRYGSWQGPLRAKQVKRFGGGL
jgi:hypothetical protein